MFTLAIFVLVLAVPLTTLPTDIRRNIVSPYIAVIKAIITTMVAVMAVMAIAKMSGHALFDSYHAYIVEVSKTILADSNLRGMVGLTDMADKEALETLTNLYDTMIKRLPGYLMLMSAVISYFGYILISKSMSKKHQVKLMPKFKEFTFPRNTVMAMVIMYFIAWFTLKSGAFGDNVFYLNINYIFDLVFAIQGAAVIFMYFDLKRLPKILPIIIVLICWNIFILREFLVIMGMIDLVLGIRGFLVFKEQNRQQNRNDRWNNRR